MATSENEASRTEERSRRSQPVEYTLKHFLFIYNAAVNFVNWIKEVYEKLKGDPFKKIEDFATKVLGPRYIDFKNFLYNLLVSLDKAVDSVLKFAANVWLWFILVLLFPVTSQFSIIKTAFRLANQYNLAVLELKLNYYSWAKYIPFIPVRQIGSALKVSILKIIKFMDFPVEAFKTDLNTYETRYKAYEDAKKEKAEMFR